MNKRIFLIVLDSFGIGNAPDARAFGDFSANTLSSVAGSKRLNLPVMRSLGLFNIDGVDAGPAEAQPIGSFARLFPQSAGKDTVIGHWEIAGIVSQEALPTFPDGFPPEFIRDFEAACGYSVLCNKPYSGTEALRDYGGEHLRTGRLIVYTSADSVFQIAAHESVVPPEKLYDICRTARRLLAGKYAVGRVIARPFEGDSAERFRRTERRHDFSLPPPGESMLTLLQKAGYATVGVGKIHDIFAGEGLSESIAGGNNQASMDAACELLLRDFEGLAFINLVDFDMIYGHRRDIDGYAGALSEFDRRLSRFMAAMRPGDILMLTADHGCDPGFLKTTDHTREAVPLIAAGEPVARGVNLGSRSGFADISATALNYFGVENTCGGSSFWQEIKR